MTFAKEQGLSRDRVDEAHQRYMRDLIRTALVDGIITTSENRDLQEVRRVLDISQASYAALLEDAQNDRSTGDAKDAPQAPCAELNGKSVCFTGALNGRIDGKRISRSGAQELARDRGMVAADRCTKSLDFLVVADPDSTSRKAQQARRYGVRILAESVFWRTLGVDVE
jgi:DNA polymerase-3 subunit epsilon